MPLNVIRSDELFRSALDASPAAMILIDKTGKVVFANIRAAEMFGYTREEFHVNALERLVPARFLKGHLSKRLVWFDHPVTRHFGRELGLYALHKDGHEIPVEIGISAVHVGEHLFALGSMVDISERIQHEQNLKQVADDLIRSNQDLEQFAYIASHDLQEPLRMITSYARLVAKRNLRQLDAETLEYITYMQEAAARMQKMIEDLLDYSRLGRSSQTIDEIDCNHLVREILGDMQELIQEKQARVDCQPLPVLLGVRSELRHLFLNVISNAVKFSKKQQPPEVHVNCLKRPDCWEFRVMDRGIGIDPECLERIFKPFQRLHARTEYPGTGIGLTFSKKIVEMNGGKIWVESEPGQGSVFYFTLPRLENH